MGPADATDRCNPGQHATWHLHWQAAVGQTFLPMPSLAERIRERLIAAHRRRRRILVDFCILPTEIHVISHIAEDDTPGKVAGAIGNVVARWVREARQVRTPVMCGPFRARLICSDEALRIENRMLAWRPVVLGLCRGPTFYPHGALRTALGMRPSSGFDVRPMLRWYGNEPVQARRTLRQWLSRRPSTLDWRAWELARGLVLAPSTGGPRPTGFREVKTAEAAALIALAGDGGIAAALDILADWVSRRIDRSGAADLYRGRDARAARGRALVARLATRHALCSSAFVARHFGKAKSTLSEQISASRRRDADTGLAATPMAEILVGLATPSAATEPASGGEAGQVERLPRRAPSRPPRPGQCPG